MIGYMVPEPEQPAWAALALVCGKIDAMIQQIRRHFKADTILPHHFGPLQRVV